MKDLNEVIIPKNIKHLMLVVYKSDGNIFGVTEIDKKGWKNTYTKFIMGLTLNKEPYKVRIIGLDENAYKEKRLFGQEVLLEEDIDG